MNEIEAINNLENIKWLKGCNNTTVGGTPLVDVIDDIIALIKQKNVRGETDEKC